ncbi:MAG TPA: pseudouridine synthase [Armatimonadota bacterium]|nr:pseudouridine synthase [Armatimonadota bacterium]
MLAAAGVASRRDAETLISSGKVSVNGRVVKEPGFKIDPERDHVAVEGRGIPRDVELLYVALYKPKGCVTTREDPHATNTVMQLIVPPLEARLGRDNPSVRGLHPVGRLDAQTEGLLILTNDGDFTNALTHPRHQVPKVYTAEVRGIPTDDALEKVRAGIPLFGRRTLPARVRVTRVDRGKNTARVEVTLREGRNQQVRRMLQAVGYPVSRLMRIAVGPVRLSRMKPGQWRFLTPAEVEALKTAAVAPEETAEPAPRRRPSTAGRRRKPSPAAPRVEPSGHGAPAARGAGKPGRPGPRKPSAGTSRDRRSPGRPRKH